MTRSITIRLVLNLVSVTHSENCKNIDVANSNELQTWPLKVFNFGNDSHSEMQGPLCMPFTLHLQA